MEESEDDLPISSVFFNVADVVPSCEDDPSTSPVMKRKNRKLKKSKRLFIHKKACSCRFCVNPFLKSQQCKIALLYSSYLEVGVDFLLLRSLRFNLTVRNFKIGFVFYV